MNRKRFAARLMTAGLAVSAPLLAAQEAQPQHEPDKHTQQRHGPQRRPADGRLLVKIPAPMRRHMLSNMRDHLLALQQIQDALANEAYDKAAVIAEQRLGMTSLQLHGAHEVAPFMPEEMRAIGAGMHRAASRFAVTATDAAASGDVKPALAELAHLTAQCVACHEGFRVQ